MSLGLCGETLSFKTLPQAWPTDTMDPSLKSALSSLPAPDETSQQLSLQLADAISAEIESKGGRIPFDRFMELALYHPGLGYYSNDLRKFGEQGDFITAPELTPLFGHCIARQCAEALEQLDIGSILEFGAGSGRLAADLLGELERLDRLPERYYILELSAALRQRQQELLQQELPSIFERIEWLDQLPESFSGVVVANEVLDAMPVSRILIDESGIKEQYVALSDQGFYATWDAIFTPELQPVAETLQNRYSLPIPYETEINLRATSWISELSSILSGGMVLLIDYGYSGHEFYHPQRNTGTLICHYRHRTHGDPLFLPGLQDITANVDFTAVAEAALAAGFDSHAFTPQAYFLLAGGLEQLLMELELSGKEQLQQIQAIKRLTLPNEMGERFKVLALGKGLKQQPSGFSLHQLPLKITHPPM